MLTNPSTGSLRRLMVFLWALVMLCIAYTSEAQTHRNDILFVGTYCPADSQGIFVYHFDSQTGHVKLLDAIAGIANPSFLTLSPDHHFLYAVSETHGADGGHVFAYRWDAQHSKLHFLNEQPSGGKDPCHLSTDHTGKWLLVANYTSGSVAVLPIHTDGSLGAPVQVIQHQGHGPHPQRQEGPHVHFVNITPDNQYVLVSDLGLDKIFIYQFDARTGRLTPATQPFVAVDPGAGPRHQAFSPDHRVLYLIQEMGWKITAFRYHQGQLNAIQTVSTVEPDFHGVNTAADIHLSPDGRFLYASNRGALNDIVIFAVYPSSGKLKKLTYVSSGGKTPRNFVISPDGQWLLVGHQDSDEVVVFRRNTENGMLTRVGHWYRPRTVCLKMLKE